MNVKSLSSLNTSDVLSDFFIIIILLFTQHIFSVCLLCGMDWVNKTTLDPCPQGEKY